MKVRPLPTLLTALVLGAAPLSAVSSTLVDFTFTDLDRTLVFERETSFIMLDEQEHQFTFTNATGLSWGGFRLELEGAGEFGSYDFMRFVPVDNPDYSGPGTATFSDGNSSGFPDVLDISGLNVADDSILGFSTKVFGGAFPEGMTAYSIFGTPFALSEQPEPTPAVPEPGTALLFGAGLLGLAAVRRRLRTA